MPDYTFPRETVHKVVHNLLRENKEIIQTLCVNENNEIFLGEPLKKGDEYHTPNITKSEMRCPAGTKPIGTIHSHLEEYTEPYPFNRGYSNEDIFGITKDVLNDNIDLPYLGCVTSPEYDENDKLKSIRVGCELYKPFTEEDIKKMPNGIVIMKDDKTITETFDEDQIDAIRNYSPPSGGWHVIGFAIVMANLKMGLEKNGFLEYDDFVLPVNYDEKTIEIKEGKLEYSDC